MFFDYNSSTRSFFAFCLRISLSCAVEQWMPSSFIRLFWWMCCERNEWSFRKITPTQSSNMAATKTPIANNTVRIILQIACKDTKIFSHTQARARFSIFFLFLLAHFKKFLYLCPAKNC